MHTNSSSVSNVRYRDHALHEATSQRPCWLLLAASIVQILGVQWPNKNDSDLGAKKEYNVHF